MKPRESPRRGALRADGTGPEAGRGPPLGAQGVMWGTAHDTGRVPAPNPPGRCGLRHRLHRHDPAAAGGPRSFGAGRCGGTGGEFPRAPAGGGPRLPPTRPFGASSGSPVHGPVFRFVPPAPGPPGGVVLSRIGLRRLPRSRHGTREPLRLPSRWTGDRGRGPMERMALPQRRGGPRCDGGQRNQRRRHRQCELFDRGSGGRPVERYRVRPQQPIGQRDPAERSFPHRNDCRRP